MRSRFLEEALVEGPVGDRARAGDRDLQHRAGDRWRNETPRLESHHGARWVRSQRLREVHCCSTRRTLLPRLERSRKDCPGIHPWLSMSPSTPSPCRLEQPQPVPARLASNLRPKPFLSQRRRSREELEEVLVMAPVGAPQYVPLDISIIELRLGVAFTRQPGFVERSKPGGVGALRLVRCRSRAPPLLAGRLSYGSTCALRCPTGRNRAFRNSTTDTGRTAERLRDARMSRADLSPVRAPNSSRPGSPEESALPWSPRESRWIGPASIPRHLGMPRSPAA